jgi:hypothetical protein
MATTTSFQAAKAAAERYTFFNRKLREDSYATGDIYDHEKVMKAQSKWATDP